MINFITASSWAEDVISSAEKIRAQIEAKQAEAFAKTSTTDEDKKLKDLLKEKERQRKEQEYLDRYYKSQQKNIDNYISDPDEMRTKELFEAAMSSFDEANKTLSPKPCDGYKKYEKFEDIMSDYMAKSNYFGEDRQPDMMHGPHQPSTLRENPQVDKSQAWISHMFSEIEKTGISTIMPAPAGATEYCPKYESLDKSQRDNFWHSLMMGMAYKESNFKSSLTYRESFGPLSSGLFQISLASGQGYSKYGCQLSSQADLHDPIKNSTCAVAIFKRWIFQDDVIASNSGNGWRGPARYWSVLRNKSDEIKSYVKQDVGELCY
jgi:hypothetical protein